jgi:hypothetical protein
VRGEGAWWWVCVLFGGGGGGQNLQMIMNLWGAGIPW